MKVVLKPGRHQGGAHAGTVRIRHGALKYCVICLGQGLVHDGAGLCLIGVLHHIDDVVHGHLAGNIATPGSAHAVADHCKTPSSRVQLS